MPAENVEEGRFWRESMRDNAVIIRPLRFYAQEMCQLVTQAAGSRGSAPAAGLVCNQNGPSIWRIGNNLLYTARPVLSEREPVARSPEAQRHIILVGKRCGPLEFAVLPETGLYDNEIWAP